MRVPIFVDFETNKRGDVFLGATCVDGNIEQVILHPDLAPLGVMTGCRVEDPRLFAERLTLRAAELSRPIAGYSLHDQNVLESLRATKVEEYVNIARAAKLWIKGCHLDEFSKLSTFKPRSRNPHLKRQTWSLIAISKFLGVSAPVSYGYGKTTSRIRNLQSGLERTKGDVSLLTSTQKRKAMNLIAHNAFDVQVLPVLFERIRLEKPHLLEVNSHRREGRDEAVQPHRQTTPLDTVEEPM